MNDTTVSGGTCPTCASQDTTVATIPLTTPGLAPFVNMTNGSTGGLSGPSSLGTATPRRISVAAQPPTTFVPAPTPSPPTRVGIVLPPFAGYAPPITAPLPGWSAMLAGGILASLETPNIPIQGPPPVARPRPVTTFTQVHLQHGATSVFGWGKTEVWFARMDVTVQCGSDCRFVSSPTAQVRVIGNPNEEMGGSGVMHSANVREVVSVYDTENCPGCPGKKGQCVYVQYITKVWAGKTKYSLNDVAEAVPGIPGDIVKLTNRALNIDNPGDISNGFVQTITFTRHICCCGTDGSPVSGQQTQTYDNVKFKVFNYGAMGVWVSVNNEGDPYPPGAPKHEEKAQNSMADAIKEELPIPN